MNILLVQSYLGRKEKTDIFPIGLAYLKTALHKHHKVTTYDPNLDGEQFPEDLVGRIRQAAPDVVGISLRNIDTTIYEDQYLYYKTLKPTLQAVKQVSKDIIIVIGSTAFSMFAKDIMERHPAIDFGVYLEGEESFPELLDHLGEPEKVAGIYYRRDNRVVFSGPREAPDFEKMPPPIRDKELLGKYPQIASVGIQAKRGCRMHCLYCTYPYLSGNRLRIRSPSKVVDEIENLVRKHGLKHFSFVDPIFNVPPEHASDICREIIRRKIKINWTAWFNEHFLNEGLVRLALKAGCDNFSFSPDGITAGGLKALKKNITPKDIKKVYKLARKYPAMQIGFNFFAFPPGRGLYDFFILSLFFLKCKLFIGKRLLGFGVGTIRIEPNTKAREMALKEGLVEPDNSLLPEAESELDKYFFITAKIRPYLKALKFIRNIARKFK